MSDTKWTRKRVIQTSVLFAMLVIVPLMSWYFLKGGLDYRKDALAELEDLGPFAIGTWQDQEGEPIPEELLSGKLMIAGILPGSDEQDLYLSQLSRVHDQFDNREDVYFLTFYADGFGLPKDAAVSKDEAQWKWIALSENALDEMAEVLGIADQSSPETYLSLIDETGQVRKHYDFNAIPEMGRMIEHMAVLLPNRPKRHEDENKRF